MTKTVYKTYVLLVGHDVRTYGLKSLTSKSALYPVLQKSQAAMLTLASIFALKKTRSFWSKRQQGSGTGIEQPFTIHCDSLLAGRKYPLFP